MYNKLRSKRYFGVTIIIVLCIVIGLHLWYEGCFKEIPSTIKVCRSYAAQEAIVSLIVGIIAIPVLICKSRKKK